MSATTPSQSLDRLRRMAGSGDLARLCEQYGVALLVGALVGAVGFDAIGVNTHAGDTDYS